MMKNLKMILLGFILISGFNTVNAQEASKLTPKERSEIQSTKIATDLNLENGEKSKLYEIILTTAVKNDKVRKNTELSADQKVESIRENQEALMIRLKEILTPEQIQQIEKTQKAELEKL